MINNIRRKAIKYILIACIILSCLIFIAILMNLMLPYLMIWIETHENCYANTTEAYPEGRNPEFLPACANDIRIVTDLDNANAWMTFKSNDKLPLDSSFFIKSNPIVSGIVILPTPNMFWWTKKWNKQVDEFWSDTSRLKISVPFCISWWPDDLSEEQTDIKQLQQKYQFYKTKMPYKISGFATTKISVDYMIIIVNRNSQQVYVWINW
jgi:hypothetical protein